MKDPLGAILTGGASRRLGRDKARVEVGGLPILRRVLEALREVLPEVVLVGKEGDLPSFPEVDRVTDEYPERCALAGVVRALEHAGGRPVFIAACDHPFLAPGLVRRLLEIPPDRDARVPGLDGRLQPLVAAYRSDRALPVLAGRLREGRLALFAAVRELDLDVVGEERLKREDPDLLSFLNVNEADDLERARRLAKGG